ncbi:MAG: alpha/beta hydrolase [Anaerolineae bacterium]
MTLFHEVIGKGHPLLFLHAGICDSRMWEAQVHAFSGDYQVIRYDQRGYGRSAPAEQPYSDIDDLRDMLDKHHVTQAVLVGCSKGGIHALDFTLLHPHRVKALVLVSAYPNNYEFTSDPPPIWEELVAAHRAHDLERIATLEVEMWLNTRRRPEPVAPALFEHVIAMNRIAVENEHNSTAKADNPEVDALGRLPEVGVPFLAVAGDQDEVEIQQVAALMAGKVQAGRSLVMPGVAHLPSLENPDLFNAHLSMFLKENL